MPNIASAKKALRRSARARQRNTARKEEMRRVAGAYKKHLIAGQKQEAEALLPRLYKAIDKAARTRAIHPHAARRKKSRLSQLITASNKASS